MTPKPNLLEPDHLGKADDSASSRGALALIMLASICLLPFLRLAFCTHPYLDDFVLPSMLRQHGVWSHTTTVYLTWGGRFSDSLITALHPLAWGELRHVKPFVFAFIGAFTTSVVFAGNAILSGTGVRWATRLATGSAVLALFLLMLPSPTEAFYWLISALFYMGGGVCCFVLLGVIALLQQRPRATWLWAAAGLLSFFAPGFTEMISCGVLALLLVLVTQLLRGQLTRREQLVLLMAVLGAAAATVAPGNFVRQASAHPLPVMQSVVQAMASLAYTVLSWLSNGIILLISLLIAPALQRLVREPLLPLARLTKRTWLWPTWVLSTLFLCYLFSHLAVGGPPPSRARNLLFAFFLVGWFMSLAGILANRNRHHRPLSPLPSYGRAVLLGVLALLMVTDHNFKLHRSQIGTPSNSVAQAYHDWLSGDAARYDREEEARYALIRSTTADTVEVAPLSLQPVTLVWWDISTNGTLWGNRAYAAYFHKKVIVVRPSLTK